MLGKVGAKRTEVLGNSPGRRLNEDIIIRLSINKSVVGAVLQRKAGGEDQDRKKDLPHEGTR